MLKKFVVILCLFLVFLLYIDISVYWKESVSLKLPQILKSSMNWTQELCHLVPKGQFPIYKKLALNLIEYDGRSDPKTKFLQNLHD